MTVAVRAAAAGAGVTAVQVDPAVVLYSRIYPVSAVPPLPGAVQLTTTWVLPGVVVIVGVLGTAYVCALNVVLQVPSPAALIARTL